MEIFIDILAVIMGIAALFGCIFPVIPGPPLSYVALGLLYLLGGEEVRVAITGRTMIVFLAITIVVTVVDYIVPSYFTKISGGSKAASRGALAGMIAGIIFFPPWGMIAGSFFGALLVEMIFEEKKFSGSLKPAFGSFIGFLVGTGFKLTASGIMLYYIIKGVIA